MLSFFFNTSLPRKYVVFDSWLYELLGVNSFPYSNFNIFSPSYRRFIKFTRIWRMPIDFIELWQAPLVHGFICRTMALIIRGLMLGWRPVIKVSQIFYGVLLHSRPHLNGKRVRWWWCPAIFVLHSWEHNQALDTYFKLKKNPKSSKLNETVFIRKNRQEILKVNYKNIFLSHCPLPLYWLFSFFPTYEWQNKLFCHIIILCSEVYFCHVRRRSTDISPASRAYQLSAS